MNRQLPWVVLCAAAAVLLGGGVRAEDWPAYGRDATRNPVSPEKDPPTDWRVPPRDDAGPAAEPGRNVKWEARLGSQASGSPVVAGGLVWVCTNDEARRDPAFDKDAGVLACFDERDGAFLWQHLTPRVGDRIHDWPHTSVSSPPLVEGDRL